MSRETAADKVSDSHGDSERATEVERFGDPDRRMYLKTVGAVGAATAGSGLLTAAASAAAYPDALTGIRGAQYFQYGSWNNYQIWSNYANAEIERDLDYARSLGLNSLRVLASYEYWQEDGPSFFAHVEHFLTECDARGIRPILVLFEAPPEDEPTEANRTDTDPETAFGVHSPSRENVIQPRDWSGWARSPLHFTRRWAEEFGEDSRLLATEIMNEPGDVQPRQDFVKDMLAEFVANAPNGTVTMGCKDFQYNDVYDENDDLDIHQFHMNLPVDEQAARDYLAQAEQHRANTGKPLWCTEWQRTREEPPNRFLPNYESLAPIVDDAHANGQIDGDFFWQLMLKPAYLQTPRQNGRVNGLFHEDGTPFDASDRDALAGVERYYPDGWQNHSFPYPDPEYFN
ncbi:cellulase family glycosylhydrolase [Halosolutus gelatinilyticus]|uniref:cellulase family glycosylhydrolase n=1 Tax=Halosolutus gelatinilyticus TaxID=2931975 RepID=UPI001FF1A1EE|nr:cellulase family glycosylhydrolase [Halosolutus gelatinilyticus]